MRREGGRLILVGGTESFSITTRAKHDLTSSTGRIIFTRDHIGKPGCVDHLDSIVSGTAVFSLDRRKQPVMSLVTKCN
jgi:hypothetical protein